MKLWQRSLLVQLVGYFLLLSFVTVGSIGFVAFQQSRHALQDSIVKQLTLTADLKEDELDRWVNDQQEEIYTLIQTPELEGLARQLLERGVSPIERQQAQQRLSGLLTAIAEHHSSIDEILVLTPGGKVVFSTDASHENTYESLINYSYFQVNQSSYFALNFYPSPTTGKPRMTFASPVIVGSRDRQLGVVAIHLNLSRIDEVLRKRPGLGESGETYLVGNALPNQGNAVDRYTMFVSDAPTPQATLTGVWSQGIQKAVRGGKGSGVYANYRGQEVLGVYRWLDRHDLALLVEISTQEAFAPANRLAQTIFLSGLALVGLLAIGVLWGARRIARPILAITQTATQVAAGDLTSTAPVLAQTEIGTLARVFNQMIEQLRVLYADLETKVEQRTAALTRTNEQLQVEISDRKRAEDSLVLAKEAAEAANRAKSAFLANMSHELRTPLNAILGFAQLLERDPVLTLKQRDALSTINHSGEHLLNLINDVLEMSKIEAGRIVLNPTPFNLHELLRTLQEMFQLRTQAKGLALQFVLAPDLPQSVVADEGKLRQVLINLLGNAVKFTDRGGITLRVQSVQPPQSASIALPTTPQPIATASMAATATTLRFAIEDTGCGIASEDLGQLFQPFVQSQRVPSPPTQISTTQTSTTQTSTTQTSTTEELMTQDNATQGVQSIEGTGLGLAICRQFIRLMGSEIQVQSVLHQGSTFSFDLPVKLSTAPLVIDRDSHQRVLQVAPGQPLYRILIADDRPENRRLMVELLNSVGFATRTATNGLEAIEQYHQWQPHLIWMDMRMPVMDGYEATRRIRSFQESDQPLSPQSATMLRIAPKIIALTASAFEEQQVTILAAGCDDLVRKPFRHAVIFEKMAQYLGVQYLYENCNQNQNRNLHGNAIEITAIAVDDLTADHLTIMPLDWIENLHQAALRTDEQAIFQLLEAIPAAHQSIAIPLAELVNTFRCDRIMELTQSF